MRTTRSKTKLSEKKITRSRSDPNDDLIPSKVAKTKRCEVIVEKRQTRSKTKLSEESLKRSRSDLDDDQIPLSKEAKVPKIILERIPSGDSKVINILKEKIGKLEETLDKHDLENQKRKTDLASNMDAIDTLNSKLNQLANLVTENHEEKKTVVRNFTDFFHLIFQTLCMPTLNIIFFYLKIISLCFSLEKNSNFKP